MMTGMNNAEDVERLEKLIGQLKAFHAEVGQLAKKSPNDALNPFKLKLINKTLVLANAVLGESYRPFEEFHAFDQDDMPSNSDVIIMIAQYLEEAERCRSDHVTYFQGAYRYKIGGQVTNINAAPPSQRKR